MMQAVVGLWRRVGIEAEIEVYEIAKHYELRAADQLAPAAFYNWGNSVGRPHDLDGLRHVRPLAPLGLGRAGPRRHDRPPLGRGGRGQAHRGLEGVDRHIAENALVIPLLQYVQPILHAPGVEVTPHASGALLPHLMKHAELTPPGAAPPQGGPDPSCSSSARSSSGSPPRRSRSSAWRSSSSSWSAWSRATPSP
jgi:peptide/nickel transport system substrate-binding protein